MTTEITVQLHLQTIPHFTTLQKAAARLSDALLHVAIGRFIQNTCPGRIFAGCDATGFETRHATSYYARKCNLRHAYTKVSAGSDMKTQLVCAAVVRHHHLVVGHEIKHSPKLFEQMAVAIPMHVLVLDKGYATHLKTPIFAII